MTASARDEGAVVLELPQPPASLSPNGRPNRWQKAKDTKQVRRDAAMATRNAIWEQGITSHPWPAARMDIHWRFAGVQPDSDNVVARCKAVIDGIADACLVGNDRHIRVGEVTYERVKRNDVGMTITLTKEDGTA